MFGLINLLLPIGLQIVESYIKSSSSKEDDKVLEVVKTASKYLAYKSSNTLNLDTASALNLAKMK